MMSNLRIFQFLFILVAFSGLTGCKKDAATNELKDLNVYHLKGIGNAIVKDAKCGIDLANGRVYTLEEGRQHQEDIDIAYGYMSLGGDPPIYARHFLSMSYAGCACGGSSLFSFGDQSNPRMGYNSYSVLNDTKIYAGSRDIDFDGMLANGTKQQLDDIFASMANTNGTTDEVAIADQADNLAVFHVLFTTVKGKRGIIRINPYNKNKGQDYQLQSNPIDIDVIVEK